MSISHQEIVKSLLENKAIDFSAVGKTVADLGPSIALADEPWEGFCGTMRTFFRCYKIPTPTTPVENLADLANAAGGLRG